MGLCPFHYNSRKRLFNWSIFEILYSIFVWMNFSYFYPTSGLRMVVQLNPLVVFVFFYLAMATITIVFIFQCWNAKKLAALMNKTRILFKELLPFYRSISTWQSTKYGIMFVCKTVVVSGIAQVASVNCCVILCKQMTGKVDYFVIFIISVSYFLQTLVPNMFYTFVLGALMQYHQLNCEIRKISNQIILLKKVKYDKNAYNHFRKLSQRLDYIASLHGKLTVHTINVNKIFAWQLLVIIGNFVAVLLIEVSVFLFFHFSINNRQKN